MVRPLRCPRCGEAPRVGKLYAWYVSCDRCYDGAPDSTTRNELGCGDTEAQAIAQWNERVSCWLDEHGNRFPFVEAIDADDNVRPEFRARFNPWLWWGSQ